MKVLGRRSLASVLKLAADVAFWGALVAGIALTLLLSLASLDGEARTNLGLPVSFTLDESAYAITSRAGGDVSGRIIDARGTLDVTRIGDRRVWLRLLLIVPAFAVVVFMLGRLRRLLGRLKDGRPFDRGNASDLRALGLGVLVLELVWATTAYWMTARLASELSTSGVALTPEFAVRPLVVLAGGALLVLAEVFRQGAVMKADLETAREIQFSLVPDPVFEKGPIAIHSSMEPARAVGGDYYDVIELGDGRIAFVVADVAGKGLPAALLMALLQGSLRSLLSSGLRGAELVTRLNAYLVESTPGNRMVTFFYGELDPGTGELLYVNAGHNPPLLRGRAGVERLAATGVVLGALDGVPFAEGRAQVDAGGRLVLFTDGISEAASPRDEEFGDGRLEGVLAAHAEAPPRELLGAITAAVASFCAGTPQADDMTLMVVSRAT